MTAVAFFGINFIPSIPSHSELHCNNGVNIFKYCSESFDQVPVCAMNSVANNEENSTFTCKLNCKIMPDEWDEVCKNWKVPELCEKEHQTEYLEIDTTVIRKQNIRLTQCISFLMHNMTILGQRTGMFCPADNKTKKLFKSSCDVVCDDENVMEVITSATDEKIKASYQFWMFFFFMIFSWIGMAVVVSVGDAICFEMLADKPQRYGLQRLWGSVGWGTFSIISGLLIDKFSEGHMQKNYSVGFYLMLVLMAFDVFVSSKLKVI